MPLKRKAAPYADTSVPVDRSKQMINDLLRRYGADGVQWADDFTNDAVHLAFVIKSEGKPPIMIRLTPPTFSVVRKSYDPQKGRYVERAFPNWAQSLRLLHYYVKAKVEAIAHGLRDAEEEFLADIVVRDAEGRETTVGRAIGADVLSGRFRPALSAPREGEGT